MKTNSELEKLSSNGTKTSETLKYRKIRRIESFEEEAVTIRRVTTLPSHEKQN